MTLFIIIPTHSEPKELRSKMLSETSREFPHSVIIHVRDSRGLGKGWAVRKGFIQAISRSTDLDDIFCYIDGDLDIHPREIRKLLRINADVVVGTKSLPGGIQRKIITYLSRIYIRVLFGLGVDTQTGVKVFKKHAIFKNENNGFMFDIEMLSKAKNAGFTIKEVPIEAKVVKTVSLKTIIRSLIDSIKLRIHY